jgi:RES domain
MFEKRIGGTVALSGTVGLVVTRGHTGRSSSVGSDYRDAEAWSSTEPEAIRAHPAAERFRAELQTISAYLGPMAFVRGRPSITSWRDMGPPPESVAQAGRYVPEGTTVLYLCDSIPGVFNELAEAGGAGLFVQDYLLSPSLRLADFTDSHLSEFLQGAFDMAENSMVDGRVGPTGYLFSQVFAEITHRAAFDGMIIPGIRGNRDLRYRNVVVFEPRDNWPAWSRQDAGFRFLMSAEGAV